MTILRAGLTQTMNVFAQMPASTDDLSAIAGKIEDIRRANVDHHVDLIGEAAEAGAKAVGLGELFGLPYFAATRESFWLGAAEDAFEGPTARAMREVAARHGIVVVAPIYELESSSGRRFNTALVIDADGSLLGRSRKLHIPVGKNELGEFDERFYYEPGQVPQNEPSAKILGTNPYFPVFETAAGRIGVSICYDRHFEGVVSSLVRAGAQLVFSPAVTYGATSRRMWALEFDVDAARHEVFIGGSNRFGSEHPWRQPYFGDSHFVGPNGRVRPISDSSHLIVADLDLGQLHGEFAGGWDLQRDSRPEIYDA